MYTYTAIDALLIFLVGVMCGGTSTAAITLLALLMVAYDEKKKEQDRWK